VHLGALFGLMNSLGVPGAVASQLFLGRFVDHLGALGHVGRARWDPAFYLYGIVLVIGAVCWLFVDTTKTLAASQGRWEVNRAPDHRRGVHP
jgi:hypothetical protein